MAIYGETLIAFPELFEKVPVWYDDPREFEEYFVILPSVTSSIFRNQFGALEDSAKGTLYSEKRIKLGSFFRPKDTNSIFRVLQERGWDKTAGVYIYKVEEVKGTTTDNGGMLQIKEGCFD